MNRKLMAKKCGMTRIFDDEGNPVVCTVVRVKPNHITQIKRRETDGYNALQIGSDQIEANDERTVERRLTKPRLGHFKRAGVAPCRHLLEVRLDDVESYQLGQAFDLSLFEGVGFVDVTARSIGKGYQGVIKKYGFRGGPAAHGSGFHRHAGSTGMRSTPGRCLPGGPRPSHMGDERVTVQNLRVVRMDVEKGIMLIKGSVPGPKNALLIISNAKKRST